MPHMTEEQQQRLTAVVVAARRVAANVQCPGEPHGKPCRSPLCLLKRAVEELDGAHDK